MKLFALLWSCDRKTCLLSENSNGGYKSLLWFWLGASWLFHLMTVDHSFVLSQADYSLARNNNLTHVIKKSHCRFQFIYCNSIQYQFAESHFADSQFAESILPNPRLPNMVLKNGIRQSGTLPMWFTTKVTTFAFLYYRRFIHCQTQ